MRRKSGNGVFRGRCALLREGSLGTAGLDGTEPLEAPNHDPC